MEYKNNIILRTAENGDEVQFKTFKLVGMTRKAVLFTNVIAVTGMAILVLLNRKSICKEE